MALTNPHSKSRAAVRDGRGRKKKKKKKKKKRKKKRKRAKSSTPAAARQATYVHVDPATARRLKKIKKSLEKRGQWPPTKDRCMQMNLSALTGPCCNPPRVQPPPCRRSGLCHLCRRLAAAAL